MKYKLQDIVDVTMGQSPKSEFYNTEGKGVPFLQGNRTFGLKYPTFDTFTTMVTKEAKAGDVIMSVRAPVGDLNITPVDMCLGRGVCSLRMKNGNQEFLYYMMKYYIPQLINKESGTVFGSVNRKDINGLDIDIPSDAVEQRKISRFLSMIDEKIQINKGINNNLEQQAQAIFKSWFVDFEPFGGYMPNDWKIVSFDTIINFQNGYAFKSKELLNVEAEGTYRVFKQGNINKGGGFNSSGTKSWYPISKCSNLDKFILHKGDVLMAMTDMKDNVQILGNTAIMPINNLYIVNQRVGLLRSKGLYGIEYPFIYLLTNNSNFLTDLRSRANSGVQVNLSSNEIKSSEIVLATTDINTKFNNIVKHMFDKMLDNSLENEKLSTLRDALLPKLMSGELDVSNIDL
ncbi:MAG: restriction endonuclease subunit S [Lachnospiraceae bacterium]|nr:restriction endonuclease subunit S [Lachnospiraceae bacterium]